MIPAAQLKAGMAIRIEGQIYKVLASEFKVTGGQAGGIVKTKLRNVSTGRKGLIKSPSLSQPPLSDLKVRPPGSDSF